MVGGGGGAVWRNWWAGCYQADRAMDCGLRFVPWWIVGWQLVRRGAVGGGGGGAGLARGTRLCGPWDGLPVAVRALVDSGLLRRLHHRPWENWSGGLYGRWGGAVNLVEGGRIWGFVGAFREKTGVLFCPSPVPVGDVRGHGADGRGGRPCEASRVPTPHASIRSRHSRRLHRTGSQGACARQGSPRCHGCRRYVWEERKNKMFKQPGVRPRPPLRVTRHWLPTRPREGQGGDGGRDPSRPLSLL